MRVKLFSCFFLLCYGLWSQSSREFSVSVSSADVTISGQTNVNRFVCGLSLTDSNDTLVIDANYAGDTLIFSGLLLRFPVNAFDCQIKLMNSDFQEFLRSHIYPELLVSIEEMVINRDQSLMEKVSVQSQVNINLCGANRTYQVQRGYVMELPKGQTNLVCDQMVRFTDFDMEPPVKFFGAVRAKDELSISLDLVLDIKPI